MVYGQTGAGKTHTMSGGAWKNNGLIQQSVKHTIDMRKKFYASGDWRLSVTMNQIYQSEIKDLFFKGFEAFPQLTINRKKGYWRKDGKHHYEPYVETENTTHIKYEGEKKNEIIDAIFHGLDNRKMRDTEENETSSRAHLIFSIYLWERLYGGTEWCDFKQTFVDLAGAERVAKIEISKKLYLEACFINESLEQLQRISRDLTYSIQKYDDIDFSVNPLTNIISDTLGESYTQLLLLINPLVIDLQDTLQTNQFGLNTGKVRRMVCPWGELAGIAGPHTIFMPYGTKDLRINVSDAYKC